MKKRITVKITAVFLICLITSLVLLSHECAAEIRSTHGELVFNNEQIARARTDPDYAALKSIFITAAEAVLNNDQNPVDILDINSTDLRHYERYIMRLVMAYLITDDARYYDKAIEYVNAILSYGSWDWWAGSDLVTSHLLMGLSFAYDYLYDELDAQLKEDIRTRLLLEMDDKFNVIHSGYFNTGLTSRSTLLGNHLWINNAAIYQAAVALRGDIPSAIRDEYVNTTTAMMVNKVMPLLPQDGSGQEVSAYTLYGLHYLLRFLEIKKMNEDINLYTNKDYLKKVMYFMHYMLFPDHNIWANIGDHSNTSYWYSPHSFSFKLASEYNDPVLQRVAVSYHLESPMVDTYPTFSLFWFDSNVIPQTQGGDPPKIALYETNGQAVYRSDWGGDAMYVNFICGPLKTAHGHPDQNHFLVYHNGNHLITDHGFTYFKTTEEHNTLLVSGYGQIGENYIWIPGDIASDLASIKDFYKDETASYTQFTGDATNSYRDQCDLELYERHFSILNDYIFIVDKVKTGSPKSLEIRFHNSDLAKVIDQTNKFSLNQQNNRAVLTVNDSQVTFILDKTKETSVAPTYYVPPYGYPGLPAQDLYDYLVAYYTDKEPYNNLTVQQVFDDFVANGTPAPQHGFHLSQKTTGQEVNAIFKNLLMVNDAGYVTPAVIDIDTDYVTGYEFNHLGKKITYLFNKTEDMTRTNAYGNISFKGLMVTAVAEGSQTKYYTKNATVLSSSESLGDINGDGSIEAYDASLAARYAARLILLTADQIQVADVNQDGVVSAADAASIARYAAGIISTF